MATKRNSFANLSELGSVIEGLDDYESRPIRVLMPDNREILSERVHGMVNTTQNRVTMSVSKDYPVFDHKTALHYVQKELEKGKIGVHGFIDTIGDRTYSRILFDELSVADADSKVELGMSFENPMDRKTRFKGYGYTWRQICSNGAGIKKMLPIMEINERHTRTMEITVPPKIHDFVTAVLGQSNHMQTLIDSSMKARVKFDSNEQLLETLKAIYNNITERHIKRIANKIEQDIGLEPTRWDMFNASNFMTSHSPVTPDIRSEIDRVAEMFLDVNIPITPVTIIRKVTIEQEEIIRRPSDLM
jgi:hypothetical protein